MVLLRLNRSRSRAPLSAVALEHESNPRRVLRTPRRSGRSKRHATSENRPAASRRRAAHRGGGAGWCCGADRSGAPARSGRGVVIAPRASPLGGRFRHQRRNRLQCEGRWHRGPPDRFAHPTPGDRHRRPSRGRASPAADSRPLADDPGVRAVGDAKAPRDRAPCPARQAEDPCQDWRFSGSPGRHGRRRLEWFVRPRRPGGLVSVDGVDCCERFDWVDGRVAAGGCGGWFGSDASAWVFAGCELPVFGEGL